jgi:hypothetical protein
MPVGKEKNEKYTLILSLESIKAGNYNFPHPLTAPRTVTSFLSGLSRYSL